MPGARRIGGHAAWVWLPDRDRPRVSEKPAAPLYRKRGISAAEEIGEGQRSVEQRPDHQQCPLVHSVAFASVPDMAGDRLLADAQDDGDLPVALAACDPQQAVALA